MRVSLVVVTYRSAAVLPACLAGFRREGAAVGADTDVVVVDHSEDAGEVAALEGMEIDRLLVRPNRGYAAGVNVGVTAAAGDVIVIANPDVELLPGSLRALLGGLESGFTVVGPKLVWDRGGRVFLPVPEDPSPRAELARLRRLRSQSAWEAWLTPAIDEMWRLWSSEACVEAPSLRGPCLAVRRRDFARLGPWDEGYFLYSEETDWLWRARRRGARLGLAAAATVRHDWGHATRHLEDTTAMEARSHERFLARNYSPLARALCRRARRRIADVGLAAEKVAGPEAVPAVVADLWLVSLYPHFLPAAGWLDGGAVPEIVVRRTRQGAWWVAAMTGGEGAWQIAGAWRWGEV